jgi:PKHD-type hydroxylase
MNVRPSFDSNSSVNQTNYYWFDKVFSSEDLSNINNLQNLYSYQLGTVVGDDNDESILNPVRKSNIKWIPHDENSLWLYDRIQTMVLEANEIWQFQLNSIIDSIQYTEYYDNGGHYGWHMDIGPHPINHRKISITIQLSNPDEYEGGDLELWTGIGQVLAPRSQGCAVLFPSFIQHRVTPVTKGTRKSLVLWVGGGSYK